MWLAFGDGGQETCFHVAAFVNNREERRLGNQVKNELLFTGRRGFQQLISGAAGLLGRSGLWRVRLLRRVPRHVGVGFKHVGGPLTAFVVAAGTWRIRHKDAPGHGHNA